MHRRYSYLLPKQAKLDIKAGIFKLSLFFRRKQVAFKIEVLYKLVQHQTLGSLSEISSFDLRNRNNRPGKVEFDEYLQPPLTGRRHRKYQRSLAYDIDQEFSQIDKSRDINFQLDTSENKFNHLLSEISHNEDMGFEAHDDLQSVKLSPDSETEEFL